jgi:hypothetical protein
VEGVLDIHARGVKIIIKFLYLDVVTMHLLYIKKFMEKYMCWYAHEEPYVPHDTMVERMI